MLIRGVYIFMSLLPKFFTVTSIAMCCKNENIFFFFFSLSFKHVIFLGKDTLEQSMADRAGLQAEVVLRRRVHSLMTAAGSCSSPVLVPRAGQVLLGKFGLSSPCYPMAIIIRTYLGELN